jgi:anti-sigma B factor antagonist
VFTESRNGVPSASPSLRTAVQASAGELRMSLAGELDIATVPQLSDLVDAVGCDGHRWIVLDLTDLTFCDVRGLTALLGAHRSVTSAGGHLTIVGASPLIGRMFALTGLSEVVDLR